MSSSASLSLVRPVASADPETPGSWSLSSPLGAAPRRRRNPVATAILFALAGILCLSPALVAEEQPLAFVGALVLPVDGPPIEDGALVVEDGVITAVGPRATIPIPRGAVTLDVSGKVLMPGLVDTHSHIGGGGGADSSEPIQPEVSIRDSIDMRHAGFRRARAGGITTANVMPGSGHLISGQTVYLKLRDGNTLDDLLIELEDGRIAGGLKMANGTNSRRDPPFPGTRGKSAALVRQAYVDAQQYRAKRERFADDPSKRPEVDHGLEILNEVMDGKRTVHHHTHRHDDILTVLRLSEEFGFKVVLHHVSEAWKVADEIAAAGAPSSAILVDSPGGKLEAKDLNFEIGPALEAAGAAVAYHTDDPITDSRLFLRMPALGVRAGLSRDIALSSVTLEAARMLDLDQRVGSLTAGKDADFIILSGDPFSVYTRIEETWVEGQKVFDLDDPEQRAWADGGWDQGSASRSHLDGCLGHHHEEEHR
ncbi:MAG: amidohydrolase family protein [Acidobacteriota bacterium]